MPMIRRVILATLTLCLLASHAYAGNDPTYLVHMKIFSAEKLVGQTTATLTERQTYHWTGGHDGVSFDVALALAELNAREALFQHSIKVTRAVKPGIDDFCKNDQGSGRIVYGTESRLFDSPISNYTGKAILQGCALDVTVSQVDQAL
ncbi:hypothetical protein [Pseudoxanthomonas composti]|uniref:Uncharacterized protein n=1 Tax=Pseudoxanthomonas composti TaxID=2137479 RepID=A0A4Q1JW96_9GAMM|nr:hypothetical protein [Pseudoxanthomonas composti]RXR06563.1 hypothetical protein EPA99_07945 [Pseudoxanthomonas composti]